MTGVRNRPSAEIGERYQIERELGRGATAVVYRARDRKHDRQVAVKVLRPEVSVALGKDRFLREIKLLAGLQHPHILPLYDSGEFEGSLFFVMPYVEGESLRERLNRERQLPVDDAIRIAREVADALDYAHEHNVVHRDIKPENVLLLRGHALVSDFGIARAIYRAAGERSTGAGIAVGTPSYMSPEQASGDPVIDGRTDIYALGCVIYEMLTGAPPFTGPTAQAIIARRFTETPTRIRQLRESVPAEIDDAVRRALAAIPADRFSRAADFAKALSETHAAATQPYRRATRRRQLVIGSLAGIAVVAAALAIWPFTGGRRFGGGAPVDPQLFAVLPFRHRDSAAPLLMNGDACQRLLLDALGRWRDIRVVDGLRINDVRMRHSGEPPASLDEALADARGLGAGTLIWGEVWQAGDSVMVAASLYDVSTGSPSHGHRIALATAGVAIDARAFGEMASALLLDHVSANGRPPDAPRTELLAAARAYLSGHAALGEWDLATAVDSFKLAAALDPEYADAQYWTAQAMSWQGSDQPTAWRDYATQAVRLRDRLSSPGTALLATGLLYLADGRYDRACDTYQALARRDSASFAAWYGLGECHARDPLVIADANSPSRWRFRASYERAVHAYQRALKIVPSSQLAFRGAAFGRLPRLLFTDAAFYRAGVAPGRDTLRFAASPSMDHDTLAFVPWPIADFMSARPWTNPATLTDALAHGRTQLRDIAQAWVDALPGSADAQERLSLVLESTGELDVSRAGSTTALAALRRARTLATDDAQRLRLAASEVRLRVKLGDFDRAGRLADSLLMGAPTAGAREAEELVGLAALTGRVGMLVSLLQREAPDYTVMLMDGSVFRPSAELAQAAVTLHGYSSVGAPADSLRAALDRVRRLSDSYIGPTLRARVRDALLTAPLSLAVPVLGVGIAAGANPAGNYLLEMERSLARGDTAAMRTRFAEIQSARSAERPGDVSIDATLTESWLLLAIADTAAATRHLDLSLSALSTLGMHLVSQVPQAAGLPRAMLLRAELAARAGDRATAARWGNAVAVLWSHADAELQPAARRARQLAGGARE